MFTMLFILIKELLKLAVAALVGFLANGSVKALAENTWNIGGQMLRASQAAFATAA